MSSSHQAGLSGMVIVSGFLHVRPAQRAAYLERCREVAERARLSAGCLDFALSADLLDPGRVNVLERWSCPEAVEEFRGEGPPDELSALLLDAEVGRSAVTAAGQLAGAGEVA